MKLYVVMLKDNEFQGYKGKRSPALSANVKFFLLSNLILHQPFDNSIVPAKNLLFGFIFVSVLMCLIFHHVLTVEHIGSEHVYRGYFASLLLISSFILLSLLDHILNVFHAQIP